MVAQPQGAWPFKGRKMGGGHVHSLLAYQKHMSLVMCAKCGMQHLTAEQQQNNRSCVNGNWQNGKW